MARARTVHRCRACGAAATRWAGRCPMCGEWNSLVEELPAGPAPGRRGARGAGGGERSGPVPLAEVEAGAFTPRPTGLGELDRVLGGGLVPGSVTLVGGEPGIGKSTLLLQVLASVASTGDRALLVTAEESAPQVRLRGERLGALRPRLFLLAETSLPHVLAAVEEVDPQVLVVDSIQTVADPEVGPAPGSVAQVRACAARLVELAKERGPATLLVGHVTKDGSLAGPRVLEHAVDTVLSFDGDRHHGLRLLRAVKHRFGPTSELGVFEMGEAGLAEVADPSRLFLADRRPGSAGSAVVPAMVGRRPLLVELQALVVPCRASMPRRTAQGLDAGRLALLLAVLERHCGLGLGNAEVFASAAGGVRLDDTGADLALALALASSWSGLALPSHLVACGEVGLGGELRQAAHTERRLGEAARLGFRQALVPESAPEPPAGLDALRAATLGEALARLRLAA